MKAKLYKLDGTSTKTIELPDEIFKAKENAKLLSQVIVALRANKRKPIAKTKNRGEVSGGGKKPFRQKGTGNARAGSTRSPLWIGGGVTFGPSNSRNFGKRLPSKMAKSAFRMALSEKAKDNRLIILESLDLKDRKTKVVQQYLEKLPIEEGSILAFLGKTNVNWELATANLPFLKTIHWSGLNLEDIVTYDYLLTDKSGIEALTNPQKESK